MFCVLEKKISNYVHEGSRDKISQDTNGLEASEWADSSPHKPKLSQ